jgi:hypothetical protein
MPFIGNQPTAVPLTSADLTDGIITVNKLASTLDLSSKTITLPSGVGGKVLQVVNGTSATEVGSSSATLADTGLSASITPSSTSNKILVLLAEQSLGKVGSNYLSLALLRNGSQIADLGTSIAYTADASTNRVGGSGLCYLDSPNTTSSVTYKTQFGSTTGGSSVAVQINNSLSTITLMEIAG